MYNPDLSAQRSVGSSKLSTSFLYFCLAPLLGAFTGFHTASYMLAGLYTWPRTSRVMVLIIGMLIFSYEFIFKNHTSLPHPKWKYSSLESVMYTCIFPFLIGIGVLWVLAGLSP